MTNGRSDHYGNLISLTVYWVLRIVSKWPARQREMTSVSLTYFVARSGPAGVAAVCRGVGIDRFGRVPFAPMTVKNFPPSSIVHEGPLPPERFSVELRSSGRVLHVSRMSLGDEREMREGIASSERLLRPWLTWHDAQGSRSSWTDVAQAVANEFATSGWWDGRHWFNWLIRDGDTGKFLGMVDTGPRSDGLFEMGYWSVDDPAARGVITPVVAEVVKLVLGMMGAEGVRYEVNESNLASRRVALAMGASIVRESTTDVVPGSSRSAKNLELVLTKDAFVKHLRSVDMEL